MTATNPLDDERQLGEVLMTQAVVKAGSVRGWGMGVGGCRSARCARASWTR